MKNQVGKKTGGKGEILLVSIFIMTSILVFSSLGYAEDDIKTITPSLKESVVKPQANTLTSTSGTAGNTQAVYRGDISQPARRAAPVNVLGKTAVATAKTGITSLTRVAPKAAVLTVAKPVLRAATPTVTGSVVAPITRRAAPVVNVLGKTAVATAKPVGTSLTRVVPKVAVLPVAKPVLRATTPTAVGSVVAPITRRAAPVVNVLGKTAVATAKTGITSLTRVAPKARSTGPARISVPSIRRLPQGVRLSPLGTNRAPLRSRGPVLPSPAPQQRSALPVAPAQPSSPQNSGGNNNKPSSSNSNSGGSPFTGIPIAGILLGRLPIKSKEKWSKIISGFARRQENGIGYIFGARSPNISKMNDCILAFVHQRQEEEKIDPNPGNQDGLSLGFFVSKRSF